LIPDSLEKPMGGMGVLCKNILQNLTSNKFKISVVGTKQEDKLYDFGEYKSVQSLNLMIGQTDPIIFGLLNQMAYNGENLTYGD
jgi:hypothetical protein